MEVLCNACRVLLSAGDGIDTRTCGICGAMVCREEARKGSIRTDGGQWRNEVVCKDSFACIVRHAQAVIR